MVLHIVTVPGLTERFVDLYVEMLQCAIVSVNRLWVNRGKRESVSAKFIFSLSIPSQHLTLLQNLCTCWAVFHYVTLSVVSSEIVFNSVLLCFAVSAYKFVFLHCVARVHDYGWQLFKHFVAVLFTITIMAFCFIVVMLIVSYCMSWQLILHEWMAGICPKSNAQHFLFWTYFILLHNLL